MARARFQILDVFTDRAFAGNRLAVVFDARPLTEPTFAAVAREFGFSETVFALPSRRSDCVRRLRIFTPEAELPFAGHPTIGAALALTAEGYLALSPEGERFAFDLDAGPTAISIDSDAARATVTAPLAPTQGTTTGHEAVAEALRLTPGDVMTEPHEPVDSGAGLPFLFARLASLDALARARPDRSTLARLPSPGARHGIVCYTPVSGDAEDFRVRVFVPEMGIEEDPATGSAAAGLGGLLATLAPSADGSLAYRLAQGIEMGRPSRLDVRADKTGGIVTAVHVTGAAVMVADGWLALPAA
ncbi:MAG: PhzF family phenazine biosynthesis protein [Pseudomonadota bacterium]